MIFLKRYKKYSVFRFNYNTDYTRIKQKHDFTIINQLWIEYTTDIGKINLSDITIHYDNKIVACGITHCNGYICGNLFIGDTYWQFNKTYKLAKKIENTRILYDYFTILKVVNFEPNIYPILLYEKDMKTNKINYANGQKVEHRPYCAIM